MFLKIDFKEIYNSKNSISFYLIPKCPSILRHAAAGKRPSLKNKNVPEKAFHLVPIPTSAVEVIQSNVKLECSLHRCLASQHLYSFTAKSPRKSFSAFSTSNDINNEERRRDHVDLTWSFLHIRRNHVNLTCFM